MKIYNKQGSHLLVVNHGGQTYATKMFLVHAIQGDENATHICHELIIAADSAEQAVALVKLNAQAVIDEIHKQCSPEDFRQVTGATYDETACAEASRQLNKLLDIEERTEADQDDINELRQRLNTLRRGTPKTFPSHFDNRCERMTYLLDERTKYRVEEISRKRAIPVSYFDDSRSISSTCA